MKRAMPPAIRTAALSLLAPYYPGLDEAGLLAALHRQTHPTPTPAASATPRIRGHRPDAASQITGMSIRSLRNLVKRGILHHVKPSRKCVIFDERELSRLLAGELAPLAVPRFGR